MCPFIDLRPVFGVHPKRRGGGFVRYPHGEWTQTASDSQAGDDNVIDGQQVLAFNRKHDSTERVVFMIGRFDGNFVVHDIRRLGGSIERCHAAAAAGGKMSVSVCVWICSLCTVMCVSMFVRSFVPLNISLLAFP